MSKNYTTIWTFGHTHFVIHAIYEMILRMQLSWLWLFCVQLIGYFVAISIGVNIVIGIGSHLSFCLTTRQLIGKHGKRIWIKCIGLINWWLIWTLKVHFFHHLNSYRARDDNNCYRMFLDRVIVRSLKILKSIWNRIIVSWMHFFSSHD